MAARRSRRRGGHHDEEHENEERWLLTYSDMITLLMCLFMVMFSISSVNTSKFEQLQRTLKDAFSGKVFTGGQAVMQSGSEATDESSAKAPVGAVTPLEALNQSKATSQTENKQTGSLTKAATKEDEDFARVKKQIDELVRKAGLRGHVVTQVRRRGLVVQLLTDKIFYDSGRAALKPPAMPILKAIGTVLRKEAVHPVVVEGYTDSQPISGGIYPSNWELSGARAASVVRQMLTQGVEKRRLSLAGYADEHPVDTNASAAGRSRNRRVEIVLTRMHTATAAGKQS